MITKYHAKYYANILTQKSIGGSIDSISQSLLNAAVDINPHQIEAALFAFRSPLSKGVILADEVGLGKTIEAGLVICQYWATGKRKIIIVCPAALRKQWSYELNEKFGIDNEVMDTKNYNEYFRDGNKPFAQKKVVICSYNFAARKKDEIKLHGFDLAVIDEAHKLRNVYKKSSKTAQSVKDALDKVKKLLLTATPFQNSLMELYGLTSVIDENIFGDSRSFRAEYVNEENYIELQERMSPYYKRTLRSDVKEYINYTNRLPLTQQFEATDSEQQLYDDISEFLRRDNIYSVPTRQKMLTTMMIRKILASSTFALIGTLITIKDRLEKLLSDEEYKQIRIEDILDEDELELLDEEIEDDASDDSESDDVNQIDKKALAQEIETINGYIESALKIKNDSKSAALLNALENSFTQLPIIGANRRALIFTESTRTQKYLKEFLEENGYGGKIAIFNGSNSDKESNAIYHDWCERNAHKGVLSGIQAVDRRMALVEYFRDTAEIMIATEAAAEGLNLQFCSLVVNYDLPWNPQRIEQRIGRCHRYGQRSDVVVVNFVNLRNYADMRVYNLLMDKFHLFNNVFGVSDEILGQTDGIDFEKRILQIYQECRTEKEINDAFEQLQEDMLKEIDERLRETKSQVLQNFDIDVQERLKLAKEQAGAFLNRYEYIFWVLTKFVLEDHAVFDDHTYSFVLTKVVAGCKPGKYDLLSKITDGIPYRLSHPLAQYVVNKALELDLESGKIIFEQGKNVLKITLPESLRNTTGYMVLSTLDVSAFDTEQYSLFTAYTRNGYFLSQEDCEKLFLCAGIVVAPNVNIDGTVLRNLKSNSEQHVKSKLGEIDSRNLNYFREEEDRIFRWEKDLINNIEHELDIVKRQIREQERLSRNATNLEEKAILTRKIDELERLKRRKRNELADREDEIGERRREMIAELDKRMVKQTTTDDVFIIEWQVN
ncbi:RNA polymerase-associated protein RapA [Paenibacillus polymyxa E681]|uniref:SNF2-related protein n=1 Tax=Paenibacillus polymyxa TaxID=1406 RepID=UPI0001E3166E|nr:SNF2-related protein [Paenibacillus polymyxa]ADM68665.1 DNA helicase [Paenibacillus polymyxa E681]QNV55665.1 RNA polymerase-associated protein RapA [Paenibacillus polymyxa E681]QNV60501.1 RNA polymerase-associated protein RapA [Paenibacillus polymyxa E681]